jgi:hypothetical protein
MIAQVVNIIVRKCLDAARADSLRTNLRRLSFYDARYLGLTDPVDFSDGTADLRREAVGPFFLIQIELHFQVNIHARHVADDTMKGTSLLSAPVNVSCKICGKKRAKRHCPGVDGDICPACCGAERENSIDCPLDCTYLQEARLHDRPPAISAEDYPNQDIKLSEDFIRQQEHLVLWLGLSLSRVMEARKAVDGDAREGLEALIKTYRTRESGLIYETRPQNPYAADVQEALKQSVEELQKRLTESQGMHTLRDADVLGTLVFLQRLELQHNNGRRRSRAFFDFLRAYFPAAQPTASVAP